MNRWDCDFPGCKSNCIGVGGAIGLRAIGWHFDFRHRIFCPMHRPDANVQCEDQPDEVRPCEICTGRKEAMELQEMIMEKLDVRPS